MWKRLYLVIVFLSVPVLSNFSPSHVIESILRRLGVALDYISQHYEKINVDCLFGIVLAGAILDDTGTETGPYQGQVKGLKNKTVDIYSKTLPLMQKQPNWDLFSKHVVVPDLWPKPLKYKVAEFRMAYARKSLVEALFSSKTYQNFSEGLTDSCLSSIVNSTLNMKPQTICHLSSGCEKFVENLENGSGYMLTHRLLILQVARARKCKMHPKILATAIKTICTTIYFETISVEYYLDLDEIFDLFLEQNILALLCGFEGYADFLKIKWLEKILQNQHGSGCFPNSIKRREKRDANLWENGCVDHTTGLGIAVLSIYLNYVLKNGDTIALKFEWL